MDYGKKPSMNTVLQKISSLISRSYSSGAAASVPSIQSMYDSLSRIRNVDDIVLSPWTDDNILSCARAMNTSTLDELSINDSLVKSVRENICMNIHSNSKFQIAVFIIPAGWSLPLHDHPGMCVLSKLITGKLYYSSFTPKVCSRSTDMILFDKEVTERTSQDDTWLLGASQGNYHELVAQETCVMLDALLPPYDFPDRPCTYYEAREVVPGEWKLDVVEEPDNLPYSVQYYGYRPTTDFV